MLMSLGTVESTVHSCQEAGTALLHIPSGFPGISGHFCEHSHFFTSPTPTCLFSARPHSLHNSLLPTRVLGRQSTTCVYTSLNPEEWHIGLCQWQILYMGIGHWHDVGQSRQQVRQADPLGYNGWNKSLGEGSAAQH